MSLTNEELSAFVERLASEPERWRQLVRHGLDRRSYALIHSDEDVNAWVLCWDAGHDTGFHDHDHSLAAITVIDGHVREDRLRLNGPPLSTISGRGTTFTVPATAIHRITHAGDRPSVTIHAYSPPLVRTGAYSVGPEGELLRLAQDGDEELGTAPDEGAQRDEELGTAPDDGGHKHPDAAEHAAAAARGAAAAHDAAAELTAAATR